MHLRKPVPGRDGPLGRYRGKYQVVAPIEKPNKLYRKKTFIPVEMFI